jgi:hypothetical protein
MAPKAKTSKKERNENI